MLGSERAPEASRTPPRARAARTHPDGRPERSPESAWALLAWLGTAFFLVGGADLALVWYPPGFGDPQWEFGTVSAALDGLPLYVLGLGLLLASSLASGRRRAARGVALLAGLTAVAILAAGLLYAMTIPMALASATNAAIALGLEKAIVKTALEAVVYPVVLLVVALKGLRSSTGG